MIKKHTSEKQIANDLSAFILESCNSSVNSINGKIKTAVNLKDKLIEKLKKLDASISKPVVIDFIYNELIENTEQKQSGQFFTNTDEVDIINAFCINKETHNVIDTGCGVGAFLVRAYQFILYFNPTLSHEQLLERIWGVEITAFPSFMADLNLSVLNVESKKNFPKIIQKDFSEIESKKFQKNKTLKFPIFDACIGNPPYIRQELIKNKETWLAHSKQESGFKVNKQSDLYLHYLLHTASFLKTGKRLAYVVASSWLDVNFGKDLQKYLLENFKIIAIIDNNNIRSFETASVNTIILIIEKCENTNERENNKVKFVRINKNYQDLIGNIDDKDRIKNAISFTKKIENSTASIKNKDYFILAKKQSELYSENLVNGKFTNGHWGAKHLRAPDIYKKIIDSAKDKLIKLETICEIKYGIKTGANNFFYLIDKTTEISNLNNADFKKLFGFEKKSITNWTEIGIYYSKLTKKHHLIEKEYIASLFKSQSEASNLSVNLATLKYKVLICDVKKEALKKSEHYVLQYIEEAEILNIHKKTTCASRSLWYNLKNAAVIGEFIFPSKIGEKYRLVDNRKATVFCDKVNYVIKVREQYKEYSDILFLILNSQLFRYFIDLFSRQLTGNQTISDVDVNIVQSTLIPKPELLLPFKKELMRIFSSLKNREQNSIFDEVKINDKKELDNIIMKVLYLSEKDTDNLYFEASKYISERKVKSESIKKR